MKHHTTERTTKEKEIIIKRLLEKNKKATVRDYIDYLKFLDNSKTPIKKYEK